MFPACADDVNQLVSWFAPMGLQYARLLLIWLVSTQSWPAPWPEAVWSGPLWQLLFGVRRFQVKKVSRDLSTWLRAARQSLLMPQDPIVGQVRSAC